MTEAERLKLRIKLFEMELEAYDRKERMKKEGIPYFDARGVLRYRNIRTVSMRQLQQESVQKDVYEGQCEIRKQDFTPVTISKDYDGKHLMELLNDKPSWDYKTTVEVIKNEGGSVDESGVIHRK